MKGSASQQVLLIFFLAATVSFFVFFLSRPAKHAQSREDHLLQDTRLVKIEGEMSQLFTTLGEVETMRDRKRYMEIVGAADTKLMEADDLWEEKTREQKGLADGLMGGMNENYEARFTNADKFKMLSEKYNLPVERLRLLKADLEIMFSEEYAEKFSIVPENEEPKK